MWRTAAPEQLRPIASEGLGQASVPHDVVGGMPCLDLGFDRDALARLGMPPDFMIALACPEPDKAVLFGMSRIAGLRLFMR
jgi:hypothetical protein